MKRYVFLFLIVPFFFACNDGEKDSRERNEVQLEENDISADTSTQRPNGDIIEEAATERDGVETETIEEAPQIEETSVVQGLEGNYTKVDPEDSAGGCSCYCVEVSFSGQTELCISPEDISISGRFSREGNKKANLYFVEVLTSKNQENEIPWDKFDTTTPIATVSLQPDGSMKLDWLGFAIDGEIAVDYAIYGKKTLEGNYKRR